MLRDDQLPLGLQEAQRRSLRLGEVLVTLQYLSSEDLENVLAAQSRLADGCLSEIDAVTALKYAAANKTSFDEALSAVESEKKKKRAQLQTEATAEEAKLRDLETSRGPTHKDVGALCLHIAGLYDELGNTARAESYYRRALQILERCFGRRHLRVASCQTKLADLLARLDRHKEAEMLYWLVLDTTQAAWGLEHLQVAQCHRSLAQLLEAQGRLREAEQFYLSSLRVMEKVCGSDSPEVTDALRHLASFWRKQGKRPTHKRLGDLLIDAGFVQSEQVDEALTFSQSKQCPLGQALAQLNFISQESLRPALQAQLLISDGVLPAQLAAAALRLTQKQKGISLEDALSQLGWSPDSFTTSELHLLIDAAEELLSAEIALGPEHAGVAILSIKLADTYTTHKRFQEAEPLYKRALSILKKSFGEDDPEVATALAKLAKLQIAAGQPQLAEPLLERALEIRRKVKGKSHLDVAELLDLIGTVCERQGRAAEAERNYQLALNIKEEALGLSADHTRQTLERLANALFLQDKLAEAEDIFLRLLRSKERDFGPLSPELTPLLERLGEIYSARRDFAKAEKQFEQALEIYEKNDKSSLSAAILMEKFASLLENTGQQERSSRLKERAEMAKRLRT